jgi:hypothetical protein
LFARSLRSRPTTVSAWRGLVERHADSAQEGAQFLGRLEIAETRGVRGTDVDDDVVRHVRDESGAGDVVVDRFFFGDGLGLADVDADDGRSLPARP